MNKKNQFGTTLDKLARGCRARISLVEFSNPELFERLLTMGLIGGTEVQVIRNSPSGGDPICIEARGYRLSLRPSEARTLHVAEAF